MVTFHTGQTHQAGYRCSINKKNWEEYMSKLLKSLAPFALAAAASIPAQADTFVRMASGPSGGSWYPLGAKIM